MAAAALPREPLAELRLKPQRLGAGGMETSTRCPGPSAQARRSSRGSACPLPQPHTAPARAREEISLFQAFPPRLFPFVLPLQAGSAELPSLGGTGSARDLGTAPTALRVWERRGQTPGRGSAHPQPLCPSLAAESPNGR